MLGEPLFEKVSFVVQKGDRIGIVGPNGAGKSTLLKAIVGEAETDDGQIKVEQERIGYLPQKIAYKPDDTVRSFVGSPNSELVEDCLKKVGLSKVSLDFSVSRLSGGQKTKLALARVLLSKPTMLLLDEPTNHLDVEAVEWLENLIEEFKGGVLIISHDRRLLDNSVNKILEMDSANGMFNEFVGGYTEYVTEKEKRTERQEEAYKRQQKEKKRMEAWLTLKRQEASVYADPSKGKLIRAMEKRLERDIYSQEIVRPSAAKRIRPRELGGEVASAKLICRASHVRKCYEKSVLWDTSFEIRGQDHVLLTGPNGSGKTTLLKMIVGLLSADQGEVKIGDNISIGYFAQEHESLDERKTVLEEYVSTPNLATDLDPRRILGSFMFSGQAVYKKVSDLSLGERVRLIFAKLINQRNEFLVLDEPTNHLDIQSREVIEAALLEYKGAILAVSHDRYFVDKVGFNRVFRLRDGIIKEG